MDKQNIRIKLRAYDNKILDQSTEEIVNTVKRTGANIKGPIPLPTKIGKFINLPKNAQILLKWLKLALKTQGFDTFTIVLVGIELGNVVNVVCMTSLCI